MFFPESEAIIREHPDLLRVAKELDVRLSAICSSSPLRADDFASSIGADLNQVVSAFDLLTDKGVLSRTEMVECERCHNLLPGDAFRQAVEDEDDFECTTCSRRLSRWSEPIVVYRMTTSALARPRPSTPAPMLGASGEEPLSDRAQCVLIAMFQLRATDSDKRRSTEVIAAEAIGDHADANALKVVMLELNSRQLVKCKTGRGGGCWLTEKGRARAEKLSKE